MNIKHLILGLCIMHVTPYIAKGPSHEHLQCEELTPETFWNTVNTKAAHIFQDHRNMLITRANLPCIESLIDYFNSHKTTIREKWGNTERLQNCEQRMQEFRNCVENFKLLNQ